MNIQNFDMQAPRIFSVQREKDHLSVVWSNGTTNKYHYVWLRDNCRAESRFDHRTGERIARSEDIPANLTALAAQVVGYGLRIQWSDGKEDSHFTGSFLLEYAYDQPTNLSLPTVIPWGSEYRDAVSTFDYGRVMGDDAFAIEMIAAFKTYGLIKLTNSGSADGEVERFANRISYVREIAFDRVANIKVSLDPYNIGFTDQALPLHTDCSGYSWPPNVMVFHCIQNEVTGGESHYVDGEKVLDYLKHHAPRALDILTSVEVEYRLYADNADTITKAPPIILNGDGYLKLMRYANWTVQPIKSVPFEMVPEYYDAHRALSAAVNDPANIFAYRCEQGDMLIINNHRVLHGRGAFDSSGGVRHFQQVFMELDDLDGFTRIFARKQGVAA